MIRSLVFDFDGTIADTFQTSFEVINSLSDRYGIEKIDIDSIEMYREKSMKEMFLHFHIPLFKAPALVKDFTTRMHAIIADQQPISGLSNVLSELKANGYSLSIITSNSVDNVQLFLKKHDMAFFDHVYSDSSLFGKNRVISRFLKKNHLDQKEAVYIGDEIRDIEAAHKSGLKIISVTWGFNSESGLLKHNPDHIVRKPAEIIDLVAGM